MCMCGRGEETCRGGIVEAAAFEQVVQPRPHVLLPSKSSIVALEPPETTRSRLDEDVVVPVCPHSEQADGQGLGNDIITDRRIMPINVSVKVGQRTGVGNEPVHAVLKNKYISAVVA